MRLFQLFAIAVLLAASASVHAAGVFYNSESQFVGIVRPDVYVEDFNSFSPGMPLNGSSTTWAAPGANGFKWTALASLGLFSNDKSLSTAESNTPLKITFTGAPVTAFGGIFTNTGYTGGNLPGTVTINTADGASKTLTNPTELTFLGYTSAVPIASVTFSTASPEENNWIQIDHFHTGVADEPWRAADINSDNKVSVGDLGILATNFGKATTAGKSFGDLNGDHTVSVGDLGILATYFNQPSAAASALTFDEALSQFPELKAAVVPEPSAAIILLLLAPAALKRRTAKCLASQE